MEDPEQPVIEAALAMAERFGIEPELAAWTARKLEAERLIDLAAPTPLNLARLLVAVMASGRPADGPLLVRAYELTTLESIVMAKGQVGACRLTALELRSTPNGEALAVFTSRDPVTVVADLIALRSEFSDPNSLVEPSRLEISRSVTTPMFRVWANDPKDDTATVFQWAGGSPAPTGSLLTFSMTTDEVLTDLAAFATGWFSPALPDLKLGA